MTDNTALDTLDAMDMDALLDGTLDDLADAPSFKPFPSGVHKCIIKWDATKKINDMPTIELSLKFVEVIEMSDPEAVAPTAGDETSAAFMMMKVDKDTKKVVPNELGQGQFKLIVASLKTDLDTPSATNREVLEATNNMECVVQTGIRVDKRASKTDESQWKYYTEIKSVNIV